MSGLMKVLVVGGGGREDALCWKIARSPLVSDVICAPGNAGIAKRARCVPIAVSDIEGLAALAVSEKPDLTVVGPEAPLALGLTDRLESEKIRVFGPSKAAAEIEGSKVFAKQFMVRNSIPTADFKVFDNVATAVEELGRIRFPVVVKADGLAAGKGVFVCMNRRDAENAMRSLMEEKVFGESGDRIVMEQFLPGSEMSFFAVSDGTAVVPLEPSQDYKRLLDGGKGPNTGGMGAHTPAPIASGKVCERIMKEVMEPAVRGMREEGRPYKGVLYAGLMINGEDIKTLEFNCRFGDPETQPVMMRMESDIVPLMVAAADKTLEKETPPEWNDRASVCVVMASRGYPGNYSQGAELKGIPDDSPGVVVFHSGTAEKDGGTVAVGGRVLGVTALGDTIEDAARKAYGAVEKIEEKTDGNPLYYRKDIGSGAFER